MQYLLTAEEYEDMKEAPGRVKAEQQETLQKACTRMAEQIPVALPWGWAKDDERVPWGCILTGTAVYCDLCPSKDLCPASQHYSK